jgi:lipid-A-disaccharide synthase
VPSIGLVNLVAGERIVPELVQHEACAENIASALEHLLSDTTRLNHLKQQLFALRNVLGGGGASERVADLALEMLKK